MSLWSVDDKIINTVDVLPVQPSSGTTSITNKIEGQTGGRVYTKDAAIIVNDGTNDRILIGFQSAGF